MTQQEQELTPNQLDNTCNWVSTHNPGTPQNTAHILACICDKCTHQSTITLCDPCAENWVNNAPQSRCGKCNGTLSWQLHDIQTGQSLEQINPGKPL